MKQEGLTVKELRSLEEAAKRIGFSERLLVENASANLFQILIDLNLGKNVIVVAGKGNNGADVLSCARKLYNHGHNVTALLLRYDSYSAELLWQESVLRATGARLRVISEDDLSGLNTLFKKADYILEGIFGIGLNSRVEGFAVKVIEAVNSSGKIIVSCDIPSGLSPDDGLVLEVAIKADYTISFIDRKRGFSLNDGPRICGRVITADIGMTKEALKKIR